MKLIYWLGCAALASAVLLALVLYVAAYGPNPLPISPLLDMMSLTGPKKGL